MNIDYDEQDDILFIRFSDGPIERDISYGWNVNVGMTASGIGQITILDAKADGMLPVKMPKEIMQLAIIG
ncbi:MAG: DUF2283 domain-containing protein [Magnetococcales bacterium]|nr:DUF2283 domain-containing protein [Magnetococcales bacterium]